MNSVEQLRRELQQLKAELGMAEEVIVWRRIGETADAAVTRYLGEHPGKRGCRYLVVGWTEAAA